MENNVEQIIAQNLIDLRKHRNLKQSELSEAIGYSDKTISRWENGTSVPDVSTLIKLAKFYNVSLEDLINENAANKFKENDKTKNHEELINFYSLICLGVLTVWVVAILLHIGLKMIQNVDFWQIYILAIPASTLVIYRKTRKNYNLKWFNFLVLSITASTLILFFYLAYLSYDFWPLFVLIIPLEGIIAITTLFPKKHYRMKRSKKEKQNQ